MIISVHIRNRVCSTALTACPHTKYRQFLALSGIFVRILDASVIFGLSLDEISVYLGHLSVDRSCQANYEPLTSRSSSYPLPDSNTWMYWEARTLSF